MLQPAASTSEPEGSGQLSGDVLDIDISVDAFELPTKPGASPGRS